MNNKYDREAFFAYGIREVGINENNPEVLDVYYGTDWKDPLHIYKRDILAFVKAVIPMEQMNNVSDITVLKAINDGGLDIINYILKGRVMIFISSFRDYHQIRNKTDYFIKKITCYNIDGRLERKNGFEYDLKRVKEEDMIINHNSK